MKQGIVFALGLLLMSLLPALAVDSQIADGPSGESLAERTLPLSPGFSSSLDFSALDSMLKAEGRFPRPQSPEEIASWMDRFSASDRVRLITYGNSYEGRPLRAAVIASPDRMADGLDALRHSVRLEAFAEKRPLVIWIGAAIHGNEASGAEAALLLIEHFLSADYESVAQVLDHCVLIVDPLQNPDGRSRFLAELNQWNGRMPNFDRQSLAHSSGWPSGRGNHYFMDLNRDWANLSQAETWGKVRLFLEFPPQVTFDLHEMGGQEGYLFSPPRAPFHPLLPESTKRWWATISSDMGEAFGREGWTCTTRDWHEEFNPNRGAAWPLHMGAVSFLGEQFNTQGASLRLPHGGTIDFREAVAHQYLAALSLIESSAHHRKGILQDYADNRGRTFDKAKDRPAAYIVTLEDSEDRALRLARNLAWMGLDLDRTREAFRQDEAKNYWGETRGKSAFPAGSLLLPLAQIQGQVARAQMEFDPTIGEDFLSAERASLEAGEGSLIYETTAWSLAMAHGCRVYALDKLPQILSEPFEAENYEDGSLSNPDAPYAFVLDSGSPGFAAAAARLHEIRIPCWGASLPFKAGGKGFSAGSVVVKLDDGPESILESLRRVASETRCRFFGLHHALSEEGPDLGAGAFSRLTPPRIALLAGSPFYQTSFGAVWHLLDQEIAIPISLLRFSQLPGSDLDRYNVLILPDASPGRGANMLPQLGDAGMAELMSWVERGGTLIALGESAWLLFSGEEPVSGLRARRQVLSELGSYLHEGRPGAVEYPLVSEDEDAWLRRFSPQGTILQARLKEDHWITGGVGARVPVMVRTDLALLGRAPGQILGRFQSSENLRLSGILWPEAAERLEESTYLYREARGRGQMIAFLGNPAYRAGFHGTARLLSNAVLLGPGMGARQPQAW